MGVETIVDKVLLGKNVPVKTRMELVKVTRKTLGSWARMLQGWGFTGVPEEYLKLQ